MNDVGFGHYLALGANPNACLELHAAWTAGAGSGPPPACAWSSAPLNKTGPMPRTIDTFAMWSTRYWVAVAVARRGVNVFMHDLDMVFHRDPYEDFAAPPLDAATLIALQEGPVNGGMMYVRRAAPNGAALWVLSQVERQDTLGVVQQQATGSSPGRLMDQNTLGAALRVAVCNKSEWDLFELYNSGGDKEHAFWKAHPQAGSPESFQWRNSNGSYTAPAVAAGCPYAALPGGCARWEAALPRWHLRDAAVLWQTMHVPADAADGPGPSELIFAAPFWTFTHGDFSQEGWSYDRGTQPITAMTHLLGSDTNFADTKRGSHVGRMLTAQAAGYVSPAAALGAPNRTRLLHVSREASWAAADAATIVPLRTLVRRLVLAAALAGLMPVLPEVPCAAAWVKRSNNTPTGIEDHRVVIGGSASEPRCFVSAGGWDSCWPWLHVAFAFDDGTHPENRAAALRATLPRAPGGGIDAAAWAAAAAAAPGDVLLADADADVPAAAALAAEQAAAVDAFTRACPEFVCADFCTGATPRCDPYQGACA
jgi:hypothetical protein